MNAKKQVRTWIEINSSAIHHNLGEFLGVIPKHTRFMAVVKSNAYGHGLFTVAEAMAGMKEFGTRGWFGVDSVVEALSLRREGFRNPMLVLGHTLPDRLKEAALNDITVTASTSDALMELSKLKKPPAFHLKFDTGMHRQGFFPEKAGKVAQFLKRKKLVPSGAYTHFASAKDRGYPTYTTTQLEKFKKAGQVLKRAGFKNMILHAAASGGALLYPESHLDMVRVGMGLYGYYPSPESTLNLSSGLFELKRVDLQPVLRWKTVVVEVKNVSEGVPVGYDLTEYTKRKTRLCIIPIGYWHGFDRGLSSVGEVLIRGRRRKVLGRVSMDMIVVDGTDSPHPKPGDEAVLVGRQGREEVWAGELAEKTQTSPYEVVTRINPLIKRFLK
ncbi:MAG: alanine racemase [Candidatus Sungbacteria bacterium RIFCSPLOWO2_01_FULL_47_32]|uniref:Alanine racemase n=1 Tax=Candidatus Sungbacteria bacterium RIFCSPHIGHO2_01_FULL_47_32 TaxID=1802264 RepID=A0A1G2K639_9BACT|nr:MAG: Alanine racemase [Parcubacteria group bacterium GW2011_GWA2_47_10]OGZ93898.1 MAG: alanine racemase [Candidatus Sungbacteria bacterium RIFCSPHIGHO2_01_FULL_47_32]OGZ99150.1 MAG: alanine racemase [Candidatus Sungbacteria bacterium RIFCSPHIGHO2_02_FULL_46_12]OHA06026.1 MAG: alanine racemase [Candidatus Sungbacteria bacterium RIFCSPLOWO2_01_FULL_47_32]